MGHSRRPSGCRPPSPCCCEHRPDSIVYAKERLNAQQLADPPGRSFLCLPPLRMMAVHDASIRSARMLGAGGHELHELDRPMSPDGFSTANRLAPPRARE